MCPRFDMMTMLDQIHVHVYIYISCFLLDCIHLVIHLVVHLSQVEQYGPYAVVYGEIRYVNGTVLERNSRCSNTPLYKA